MTDQVPDDIFALYSRFDLDEQNYRVFLTPEQKVAQKPPLPAAAIIDLEVEQAPKPAVNLTPEICFFNQESAGAAAPDPQRTRSSIIDENQLGLQNLSRHVKPVHENRAATSAPRSSSAASSINVVGMAGGVGSSTVSAALASLLSRSGRRCAIVDGDEESILPVFFRTQRMPDNQRRFLGLQSLFEPRIRIIRTSDLQSALPAAGGALAPDLEFTAGEFGHFDHLVFDHPSRSFAPRESALRICVAVPDLSSLIGARKQSAVNPPDQARTVWVLNRFNSEIALHQEILAWYKANFHKVVTVLDSPLVVEAVAEGTTVMDWAPESSVSADFANLFQIVSELLIPASERSLACF